MNVLHGPGLNLQANYTQGMVHRSIQTHEPPKSSTEADVTRLSAGAEQFAHDLAVWLDQRGTLLDPAERETLRVGELGAWWRFATDSLLPPSWSGSAVAYWRETVRHCE